MVQNTFTVDNAGSLTTVLADISSGTDAAIDTAYTITITSGISIAAADLTLLPGSSLSLDGTFPFIAPGFTVTGTVTTDLNFTGTVTLDNSVLINPAVTVSNGVTVAGLFSGSILGTSGDGGDTAINSGTIDSTGTAIDLSSGTVQNTGASSLITGVTDGVVIQTNGLVQNGGTVIGSSAAAIAVFLGAGTVDNGQIGATAALISGSTGVDISGAGVINNDGTITGVTYDAIYLGSGQVTNGQIGATSALIDGGPDGNGIRISAGSGTVANFGTIIGGGFSGVYLQGGGTLTNGGPSDPAALVSGAFEGLLLSTAGALLNYGTVQANGNDATQAVVGAFFEAGGTIQNLTTTALVAGQDWGVVVEGAAGFVTNLGSIVATGTSGLGVDLSAGGTVVNGQAPGSFATISGPFDGVRVSAGAPGAGAVVVNNGTIEGTVGVDFDGSTAASGTLTNDGLIETTAGSYAVVFGTGTERLVLQSEGAFVGSVLGNDGAGSSTTLELAGGTNGTLSDLTGDDGTVTDSAGSFAFSHIGTIALDAGASWTIATPGTLTTLLNDGSLTISDAKVTVDGATLAGSGQLHLSNGGHLVLDAGSVPSTQTIVFADATDILEIGAIAGFGAVIQGFTPGDTIIVDTTAPAHFSQTGSVVSVIQNGATLGGLTFATPQIAQTAATTPGALVDNVLCFLAGTLITTPSGQTPVEHLAQGDLVRTASGQTRPITWIGNGRVLASRGRRSAATPIIVRKNALAPNVPHADLRVTKGHSFYLDDVLIPVEFLVNHRSILWDDRAQEVALYHIELETHDVLLANGAPAESYRDDGNRWLFQNASDGWNQPPKPHYAPVLTGGPVVDRIWLRLLHRAGPRPALPLTDDPDLHLLVDRMRIDPATRTGDVYLFTLPATPDPVRIVSRAAVPQELGVARDPRCLGVAVRRLAVRQGSRFRLALAGDARLAQGFHPSEQGLRWTDGDAVVPPALFAGFKGNIELAIHLGGTTRYVEEGVPQIVAA